MRPAALIATAILLCLAPPTRAEPPPPWAPTADARPPSFTVRLSPGVAPAPIFVNALTVPLAAGTPLTAHYAWDFGDPAAKYNTLVGFAAAHVYDRPGDYAISLVATDEAGHVTRATAHIAIAPDTRRAVYVAPGGVDANTGASPAIALGSAAAAFRQLQGGRKQPDPGHTIILFQAGGTYPVTDTLNARGTDIVIGRYGDGPAPVLMLQKSTPDARGKSTHGSISIDGHADGVMIQHLTFATPYGVPTPDSKADKVGIDAITARGHDVVVRGCSFRDVDDGINANGSPYGLLVQGCDAPGPTDLRAYFIWGQGADHAYLGNRIGNSTREHNIRLTALSRVLIFDNDLTNLDRSKTDKSDQSKGCIEMHAGSFAYIAGNRVTDGPIRVGPRGGEFEKGHPETATEWSVVDGNDLTDSSVRMDPGSHHIMVRNNLVRRHEGTAFEIDAPDPDGRTSADLTVVHNTAVDTGPTGIFLKVWGHVDGMTVADNLFVAPHLHAGVNGSAGINVRGQQLDGFTAVTHNVWPVPEAFERGTKQGDVAVLGPDNRDKSLNYLTADAWNATPLVAGDRFAPSQAVDPRGVPAPGGPAAGAAAPFPGTAFDHDGRPRPPGATTAGAFE